MKIAGLFGRKRRQNGLVGLEKAREGYAIASVVDDVRRGCRVEFCEWILGSGQVQADRDELRALVHHMGLRKVPCNYVLAGDQYQLNLLEMPITDRGERDSIVVDQLQGLLSYPVEEAMIDVMPLPGDGGYPNGPMAYVVSAHQTVVETAMDDTAYAGLVLESIDISEMALRNLIDLWGCDERGEALLIIQSGQAEVLFFRHQHLYYSRKFNLPYQGGAEEPLPLGELGNEILRSLEYYRGKLGQLLPNKMYLTGQAVTMAKLSESFVDGLDLPIELMAIDEYWFDRRDRGGVVNTNGLAAIGGALRGYMVRQNLLEASA